jgi:hypothetical protein
MAMSCWRTTIVAAFALGFAIALSAQTSTPTDANRTSSTAITLTGCVERADQVSAPVTAGTTVDSLSFVLIKATRGTALDSQVAGTSGIKPNAERGSMYRLDAEVSKLNPHVGHKVEVTGTLDSASAGAPATVDPPSATNAPKVKVTSVKMIAETCAR